MNNSDPIELTRQAIKAPTPETVIDQAWQVHSVEDVNDQLQSDLARGLSQPEADRRLSMYGPKTLTRVRERSPLAILVAQFRSLIVALLAGATVIAFALGERLQIAAVYLPLLRRTLHTNPPSLPDWGVIAGCSLLPVAVVEVTKLRHRRSPQPTKS